VVDEREHEGDSADEHLPSARSAPGTGYWTALLRSRRAVLLWGLVAVLAAGAVAAALWVAFLSPGSRRTADADADADAERTVTVSTPLPSATAAGAVTASVTVPPSAPVTVAPGGGSSVAPAPPVRAAAIAYRKDGAVWVASEGGAGAAQIAPSTSGVFALSPDGLKLAVIEGSTAQLTLYDVGTGALTQVGNALPVRPSWSPDSRWLVFTVPASPGRAEHVVRVSATGADPESLFAGSRPRHLADSATVVGAPMAVAGGSKAVAVLSDGRTVSLAVRLSVAEVCPASTGMYLADAGGLAGPAGVSPPSIRFVGYDGKGLRSVVASPSVADHVTFNDLSVSPDGAWLAYAETGDDGYSRVFAMRTSGSVVQIPLKQHKDAYVVGWSASGRELLLVEGNATQGEPQSVTAIKPDGTGWRLVVTGGGL
jgi:hypothetical protein